MIRNCIDFFEFNWDFFEFKFFMVFVIGFNVNKCIVVGGGIMCGILFFVFKEFWVKGFNSFMGGLGVLEIWKLFLLILRLDIVCELMLVNCLNMVFGRMLSCRDFLVSWFVREIIVSVFFNWMFVKIGLLLIFCRVFLMDLSVCCCIDDRFFFFNIVLMLFIVDFWEGGRFCIIFFLGVVLRIIWFWVGVIFGVN